MTTEVTNEDFSQQTRDTLAPKVSHYSKSSSVYDTRIDVMRDDPPLSGQKWFCVSMVSPENPRQKAKVHAFKLRYVCEYEEEAHKMAEYLRNHDPTFDVYVGPVGKWLPWVEDPTLMNNMNFTDSHLTELIKSQAEQRAKADLAFDDRVQKELEAIKYENTPEGLAQKIKDRERESSRSLYYKMLQLRKVIEERQTELDRFTELFESELYTDKEREEALNHPYPEFQVAKSAFTHIQDDAEQTDGPPPQTDAPIASASRSRPPKNKGKFRKLFHRK